jgi:hypothetical protein
MNNWPHQNDVDAYYGKVRVGSDGLPTVSWESSMLTMAQSPYPMRLSWDTDTTIRKFRCHRTVRPSLETILEEIWNHYDQDLVKLRESRMDLFGGCYNFRRMRGGARLSMHSWGIAIDLDPDKNPLGKPYKPNSGMMPMHVVNIFERHGWTWGGRWGNRADCQHFQAADTK